MGFRVPGKVAKRLVDVGQTVELGQPLATLDQVDLKLQAEQAEAEFRAATGVLVQAAAAEHAPGTCAEKGGPRTPRWIRPQPPPMKRGAD